ncbi:MAG: alpha/beta family hydrolase [Steroidobacteraceae bacterium]
MSPRALTLTVGDGVEVSALLTLPEGARACYVLAHGAGAGMLHRSLEAIALELAPLGIATLRFQFPYMERGTRRPDPPHVCQTSVRAAVAEAARLAPGLPLFAGGRSFGGRMTSQAQASEPLAGVRGLIFLGFPLHPAGSPADTRAAHLAEVHIPMLFLQGTRDALADARLLSGVTARLGARATLSWLEDADHSWHVPARSPRTEAEVRAGALHTLAGWVDSLI